MKYLSKFSVLIVAGVVAGVPARAQTTYVVSSEESVVTYHMEHPAHSWNGESHSAHGRMELTAGGVPAHVLITIPVLSFDSHNRNRDSHMAEVVESYIFADVVFESTHLALLDEAHGTGSAPARWQVEGILTFHGVSRRIHLPVTITRGSADLSASGQFEVKLTDFDIEQPSFMLVKVKDALNVAFEIVAHAAG
jgi:polyisoprenoid-binding protein YceI